MTRVNFGAGMLNGAALVRMLLIKRPGIKVGYVGYAGYESQVTVKGPFLPHPVDFDALAETVHGLLASSEGAPP